MLLAGLERNSYNGEKCVDFFETYKQCKKQEVNSVSADSQNVQSSRAAHMPYARMQHRRAQSTVRDPPLSWRLPCNCLRQVETRLQRRREAQKGGLFS